jgi:hypothetical protein
MEKGSGESGMVEKDKVDRCEKLRINKAGWMVAEAWESRTTSPRSVLRASLKVALLALMPLTIHVAGADGPFILHYCFLTSVLCQLDKLSVSWLIPLVL